MVGSHGDTRSGEYEIKFPNPEGTLLAEYECFIRTKENVTTWIPIDPEQTNEAVLKALKEGRVGVLTITCTWIEDKPKTEKLAYVL